MSVFLRMKIAHYLLYIFTTSCSTQGGTISLMLSLFLTLCRISVELNGHSGDLINVTLLGSWSWLIGLSGRGYSWYQL